VCFAPLSEISFPALAVAWCSLRDRDLPATSAGVVGARVTSDSNRSSDWANDRPPAEPEGKFAELAGFPFQGSGRDIRHSLETPVGVFERIGKIDNFVETALELYDPRLRQHEAQHQSER